MPGWILAIVQYFQNWCLNDDTLDMMQSILDP